MDQEERILRWNEIEAAWKRFSEWTDMPPEMKMWRGRFKLAQLMIAASFYYNEETENEEIIKKRTGKNLKKYLEEVLVFLENFDNKLILHSLGELVDEKQKDWIKEKLRKDLMFFIKLYLEK